MTRFHAPARYKILGEHGRGGLGRVSRAHDHELSRDVAIKELIARNQMSEARFLREALITARLEHPGIVPVHEAGRWPDGTPFYAMKLVAGRPLRDLIAERNTVDARLGLLHHVIAVADAIAYAHGLQIIHRDLKPANIIVGEFGETIVIDWGLAKDLTATDDSGIAGPAVRLDASSDLTTTGSVLGTPAYMAPEQARGEHVDQRADVFAIGAMLWELCALQKVPPTNLRQRHRILRRAGIDRDLVTIIDKALEPDPARRYPDAGALAADLKAFKSGIRIAARSYSLLAMLSHWTRRHRALALSVMTISVVGAIAAVLYVRNISAARDAARVERDRAQLAEVSLLMEKDPTTAKTLLASFAQRSAQYALLQSRADRMSALRTINLASRADSAYLSLDPLTGAANVAIYAVDGTFTLVNVDDGTVRAIDHNLTGPVLAEPGRWIYARRPAKQSAVSLVDTASADKPIALGSLLNNSTAQIVGASPRLYLRDKTDLYSLEPDGPHLIMNGVRWVAGEETLLLICTTHDELVVLRNGAEIRRAHCAPNRSDSPMAAAAGNYAALRDANTLLLVHGDTALEIEAHIAGEYDLALSSSGALGLADYDDKAWFVRPGGTRLELAPSHPSRPVGVAAAGPYIAWGYADGAVVALDTTTNESWEFRGHPTRVSTVLIDPARSRLIAVGGHELRVWSLASRPISKVADLPCKVFHIVRSPDGTHAVMDGADGHERIWDLRSNTVHDTAAHHDTLSYGVAWMNDLPCSAGFDGRVLCVMSDGQASEIVTLNSPIGSLIASHDHRKLVMGAADGRVLDYDGHLHMLYQQDDSPYRFALSHNDRWLASGAEDGSLIVYDYATKRVVGNIKAHLGLIMNTTWGSDDLWTAGRDHILKRWSVASQQPQLVSASMENGGLRYFQLTAGGWVANTDNKIIILADLNNEHRTVLDIGQQVDYVDVSPDGNHIAISTKNEVVIIDERHHRIASLDIPAGGSGFVGFVEPERVAISTEHGLFSVAYLLISYTDF